MPIARSGRILACGLLVLAAGGCAGTSKREILKSGKTEIFLRADSRWLRPVEKGHSHPAAISAVRLSHILSRLDVKPPRNFFPTFGDTDQRVAAIETELIQELAKGISEALAQAGPDQEVVVMAVHETKRWGVFDHDYLTSFVAYVREERLYLHFSHFDWEIPKRRDDRLPEPRVGRNPQHFRLYPGTALTLVDEQSVAVDWRDAVFAQASRIQVGPGGELERREILAEDPSVEALPAPGASLPDNLSPEQLRALADLEEDRRAGRITEAVYRSRRREVLEGR